MEEKTGYLLCVGCGCNLHRHHKGDLCRMCKIQDEEMEKKHGKDVSRETKKEE